MRRSATTLEAEMKPEEHQLLFTVPDQLRDRPAESSYRILEIGTAAGGTLVTMMGAIPEDQRRLFVVVDPMNYFPDQLELVKKNLRLHSLDPGEVEFRIGKSHLLFDDAVDRGDRFSLILIDACHKPRYVMWTCSGPVSWPLAGSSACTTICRTPTWPEPLTALSRGTPPPTRKWDCRSRWWRYVRSRNLQTEKSTFGTSRTRKLSGRFGSLSERLRKASTA